ncbi:hypothetical protein [Parapedobacter tibetensis]|uniref:hypothetical protein n=1 Tax=Parapedobacter tibetensis TaxID=2972951 RepID=UPI00214D4EB2|nr:hypothetical protein [Parapedobacter tibetensis]
MKNINLIKAVSGISILIGAGIFSACNKDEEKLPEFMLEGHYIVGITAPVNSDRNSPYILTFKGDGTGILTTITSSFPGTYEVTDDSLIFQTADREKWVSFGFRNNELGDSKYEVRFYRDDDTYEPAPVKYKATGALGKTPDTNQLAGKTFVGNQYRFGTEDVYIEDHTYVFRADGTAYGSGIGDINENGNTYQLYKNVAFRYAKDNVKEFGALIDGKLVVFRESGLFYWGTYEPR